MKNKYVIVISFDAVSEEDLEFLSKQPNFSKLIKNGALIKNVESVYPSLTYPAHATIVTGKYPKNHGVINNTVLDFKNDNPDWYWYRKYIKGDTIFDLAENKDSKEYEPLSAVLERGFLEIERLFNNKGEITGVGSGIKDLDAKTSGFQKGDMVLIAARPSMGKTTFSLNIAENAALKEGKSVVIFSMEMSKEQLAYKLLCSQANVDMLKLRTGNLDDDDWERIARATGPLSKAKIYIDDTAGITVMEMRSKCRKIKMEHGIDMILIDYLQLMSGSSGNDNRQQEVSEISRSIKALAKEMECPVIALSQLSRAPEQRADHRPMLSDLRESGSIEQDADVVMFLYRDDYYNEDSEKKNIAEVIIAKHRAGSTGTVELAWLGSYTKFANLAKDY